MFVCPYNKIELIPVLTAAVLPHAACMLSSALLFNDSDYINDQCSRLSCTACMYDRFPALTYVAPWTTAGSGLLIAEV